MAEPVGIIGTAAGLVSLGLQLYGEISNYLDAVKGRQEDLDFARRQCMNLKRCIDAIDTAITSPTFLLTGSRDTLDASVQDCQRELGALNELVLRLQGPPSPASTVSAKLREKGRKLAFPFLRKGMQELESRLESTINVLQLSTQTLGLDVLRTTHVRLGNVKSVMNDIRITTVDACAKIDNLSTNVQKIRSSTSRSNRILPVIEERTANAAVLMAQQAEAVSQAGHYISTLLGDGRVHIDNRLNKVEDLLAYIADQVKSQHSHPVALAVMGDLPTDTVLAHQMMRKLVSHEVEVNGPFEPRLDGPLSPHFEILKRISTATAEDALPLNTQDYAKFRGRYPIEYSVMPHLHGACHDGDGIGCDGCDILDALLQSDCALYPSFFLAIFFGCTRNYGGKTECALKKVMLHLKERRQRLAEYAKKHLLPTQAAELGLYGTKMLDEAAGAVQTALQERHIFLPFSLRVFDADSEGTASYVWELGFRDLGVDLATGFYELWDFTFDHDTAQNDWPQFDVIQNWDIKDMEEIMGEQEEEILRFEDVLKELEQNYVNISDLGAFVDLYWGPKISLVIGELNARKLDEDDLKKAQETGIEWHCFENKPVENDYSRSSDLEYWMEKLNAIVPEPGSDIPSAPDLPVYDT
ncbi:hypothetical protein GQ607_015388 [Colletotrichum asianum]|uniref:Fungal N-terminal domain-containing protein n=1 Tax=Colletotrichum asianum TaxID=702518 RepID=A0A8H3VVP1_9PEZI|nr:hypothetical protein GQ607_015388 [Colletotrichum asianum]